MARFVERSRHDWVRSLWKLALFVGMLAFCVFVVYPARGWPLTLLVVVVSIWTYLSLIRRDNGYLCANCHKPFQVGTAATFFSTSLVGKNPDGTYYSYKHLTCPHCGRLTKARLIKRMGAREAKGGGRMLR